MCCVPLQAQDDIQSLQSQLAAAKRSAAVAGSSAGELRQQLLQVQHASGQLQHDLVAAVTFQQELAATQQQLAASQQQLAITQQQLAATKQQLAGTKGQLTAAKEGLSCKQQQLHEASLLLEQQKKQAHEQVAAAKAQAAAGAQHSKPVMHMLWHHNTIAHMHMCWAYTPASIPIALLTLHATADT